MATHEQEGSSLPLRTPAVVTTGAPRRRCPVHDGIGMPRCRFHVTHTNGGKPSTTKGSTLQVRQHARTGAVASEDLSSSLCTCTIGVGADVPSEALMQYATTRGHPCPYSCK